MTYRRGGRSGRYRKELGGDEFWTELGMTFSRWQQHVVGAGYLDLCVRLR
jgi:hypothetical protein